MPLIWKLRTRELVFTGVPLFMGIINVTPDSFSDGGHYLSVSDAVKRAKSLIAQGAAILDLGGESTRPGFADVNVEDELRRVLPALIAIREAIDDIVPISIDTTKVPVAAAALAAGAEIVNDISSCENSDMIELIRESKAGLCIMHRDVDPNPTDPPPMRDIVEIVSEFLKKRRNKLVALGIDAKQIAIDPGIGFGKTPNENWTLIEQIESLQQLSAPILVGHSRKRFLSERFPDREAGTQHVTKMLQKRGVSIVRLHVLPVNNTK
ncbi:MAG: dihydropteroate synthase [Thermoguttaceae bacterium]